VTSVPQGAPAEGQGTRTIKNGEALDANGNVVARQNTVTGEWEATPAQLPGPQRPLALPAPQPSPTQRQAEASGLFQQQGPNSLNIGGQQYTVDRVLSNNQSTVVMNGSPLDQAGAQAYFEQLTGTNVLNWRQIPAGVNHGGGSLATYTDASGATYTLRGFSSSQGQSGPVWTIEVRNHPINLQQGEDRVEIKLPRK
jgi:hypothetical protein